MRKIQFTFISLLLTFVLIACSSDEESEQANSDEETTNEEVNNEETDETQEEVINEEIDEGNSPGDDEIMDEESNEGIDEEAKERILERYPDDLRIGDSNELERSDAIGTDHVKLTVNSFKFVDELEGVEPENDRFLLLNITLENLLGDYNYETMFIQSHLNDSEGDTVQNERDELALELTPEEGGISTGDIVYDVNESNYYRIHHFDDYYLIFEDEQSTDE